MHIVKGAIPTNEAPPSVFQAKCIRVDIELLKVYTFLSDSHECVHISDVLNLHMQ